MSSAEAVFSLVYYPVSDSYYWPAKEFPSHSSACTALSKQAPPVQDFLLVARQVLEEKQGNKENKKLYQLVAPPSGTPVWISTASNRSSSNSNQKQATHVLDATSFDDTITCLDAPPPDKQVHSQWREALDVLQILMGADNGEDIQEEEEETDKETPIATTNSTTPLSSSSKSVSFQPQPQKQPEQHQQPPFAPTAPWRDVWQHLEMEGWTQFVDFTTQQEHFSSPQGRIFSSETTLQHHVRQLYGWKGPEQQEPNQYNRISLGSSHRSINSNNSSNNRKKKKKKQITSSSQSVVSSTSTISTKTPNHHHHDDHHHMDHHDSTQPPSPDPSSVASEASSVVSDPYFWNYLWDKLKAKGWTWGPGDMNPYNYYMPKVSKRTAQFGVNAFQSPDQVIAWKKRQDGVPDAMLELHQDEQQVTGPRRSRMRTKQVVKKANRTQKKKTTHSKKTVSSKTPATVATTKPTTTTTATTESSSTLSRKKNPPAVVTTTKKRSRKTTADKKNWWKNPPTLAQVKPLLETIGVTLKPHGACTLQVDKNQKLSFQSTRGLRVFFLEYGIPNVQRLSTNKKQQDQQTLERWAALVHVTNQDATLPTTSAQVHQLLSNLLFERFDGKIFRPRCSAAERQKNVHYFYESSLDSTLRTVLRKVVQLEAKGESRVSLYTRPQRQAYHSLRLWAATSTEPLPVYQNKPRKNDPMLLEQLQTLVEDSPEQSDDTSISSAESASTTPTVATTQKSKTKKRKVGPWYLQDKIDFDQVVWPMLQSVGFTPSQQEAGVYVHAQLPGQKMDRELVREFMCNERIPNISKTCLSKDALTVLHRWAASCQLEHYWDQLAQAKALSEIEVRRLLFALGFSSVDGKLFLPFADKERQTRRAYQLEDILAYIRGHPVWNAVTSDECPAVGPRSFEHIPGVSEKDMINLLFTAVTQCSKQIPTFATPERKRGRSRRASVIETPRTNLASKFDQEAQEEPTERVAKLVIVDTPISKKADPRGSGTEKPQSEESESATIAAEDGTEQKMQVEDNKPLLTQANNSDDMIVEEEHSPENESREQPLLTQAFTQEDNEMQVDNREDGTKNQDQPAASDGFFTPEQEEKKAARSNDEPVHTQEETDRENNGEDASTVVVDFAEAEDDHEQHKPADIWLTQQIADDEATVLMDALIMSPPERTIDVLQQLDRLPPSQERRF